MAPTGRLAIWDLDEMFWFGTLNCDEGEFHRDMRLGLDGHSVADQFVSPSIDLKSESSVIAWRAAWVQLQPEIVIVIGENPSKSCEVRSLAPAAKLKDRHLTQTLPRLGDATSVVQLRSSFLDRSQLSEHRQSC
jgi:hypothetical protein